MRETLLDRLESTLRGALDYNENADVAPVVLLWPDRDAQFVDAAAALKPRLPLVTFGAFDERSATGPAYWLRCVIAGTIEADLPEGTPILYLPGVAREDLRAVESCPRELAPLAELQYRGEWFAHPNGRDWTLRGLLTNQTRGLGLDVADDRETRQALLTALSPLLQESLCRLSAQYVDADFLNRLLNPDPAAQLLEWLNDPSGIRSRMTAGQWSSFVDLCRSEYDFDPARDGEVSGGQRLGEQRSAWVQVWRRFEQDPDRYRGIEGLLRKGRPDQLFAGPEGAWPQDNEAMEDKLRAALTDLTDAESSTAREAVGKLWMEHGDRRGWVWAKLDRAPLVFALEQLQELAGLTSAGPRKSLAELISSYETEGWGADAAVLEALTAVSGSDDRTAVTAAALAMYRPWLDAHARAVQEALGPNAAHYQPGHEVSTSPGTVTVFVDGLRLDLAHRLTERLGGLEVQVDTSLAALPTITETAKPTLTPLPDGALEGGDELAPARASSGAKADVDVLRSLMKERDIQILQSAETGNPAGAAWTETGDIDQRGHDYGAAFVDEIDAELDRIARRVQLLLQADWQQVDVVTDHGWLLLPAQLEKVELPRAVTVKKKGRCARLKPGATTEIPTAPWHWDGDVTIAVAPGISCFEAGKEYEHGGISLQECVVPRVHVRAGTASRDTGGAAITKVKWLGLMCRVEFEQVAPGALLDLRALPGEPSSSVAEDTKDTTSAGKQSLFVADEDLEGEPAHLVLVDRDGNILAQREVTIGSNR
jgi:hypothetical protein